MKTKNKITEVLGHDVSWFADSNSVKELDECTIGHIEKCIKDGSFQGDLNITYGAKMNKESGGWWHVINWRDIANQLYNASKNMQLAGLPVQTLGMKEAQVNFEKEWTF